MRILSGGCSTQTKWITSTFPPPSQGMMEMRSCSHAAATGLPHCCTPSSRRSVSDRRWHGPLQGLAAGHRGHEDTEKPKWARLKIQQLSKTEPVLQGQQWDLNTWKIHFFLVKQGCLCTVPFWTTSTAGWGTLRVLLPFAESG